MAEAGKGTPVYPDNHTFRLTMGFETAEPRHAWRNRATGAGAAMRPGYAVVYDACLLEQAGFALPGARRGAGPAADQVIPVSREIRYPGTALQPACVPMGYGAGI